jgi:beta-lactamase regulating signal transducer with metallopeptidase domain
MASELLEAGIAATVVLSCVILLVLLLRKPVRVVFGSSVAYLVWLLAPAALIALLLPVQDARPPLVASSFSSVLAGVWVAGALVFAARLTWQQIRFATSGPAVVGLWRPRIIVPLDFESRYAPLERELILAHERMHLQRGDLIVNAALAVIRCIFWFNPLVHAAARLVHFDQELACDELVLARYPQSHKIYANAMLKTQLADVSVPLGCHWSSSHPLKERILLLQRGAAHRVRRAIGQLVVAALIVAMVYGTWWDHQLWA